MNTNPRDSKTRFASLQKGVGPYEYRFGLERFNETLLPVREELYSSLTMKSVKNSDYKHVKGVWQYFGFET